MENRNREIQKVDFTSQVRNPLSTITFITGSPSHVQPHFPLVTRCTRRGLGLTRSTESRALVKEQDGRHVLEPRTGSRDASRGGLLQDDSVTA